MVNLLWAVHIPLFIYVPEFVPLSLGISLGLHSIIYSWIVQHPVKAISFGGTIESLIGYFTVLYLLIPFNAKKQYKQHRALRNEISITLCEKSINFKSESGESKLQWHDIHIATS